MIVTTSVRGAVTGNGARVAGVGDGDRRRRCGGRDPGDVAAVVAAQRGGRHAVAGDDQGGARHGRREDVDVDVGGVRRVDRALDHGADTRGLLALHGEQRRPGLVRVAGVGGVTAGRSGSDVRALQQEEPLCRAGADGHGALGDTVAQVAGRRGVLPAQEGPDPGGERRGEVAGCADVLGLETRPRSSASPEIWP